MPSSHSLESVLAAIYAAGVTEIDIVLRFRPLQSFVPVAGRFAGFYRLDPKTGVIKVATQQFTVGTPETTGLVFVDASGKTGPGPIGTIAASDPSVTVSLSADGQSANATMTTTLPSSVTLTWHDPAGAVPDFTVDITDQPVAFVPVSGSFGTFQPGTTA